jgi:hypothetical protein
MPASSNRAFVNSLLVYSLVAIGCTGTVGLGIVWSRNEISALARANKALATQIAILDRQSQETMAEIAARQDPVALLRTNAEWHLGLVSPDPDHLQYLPQDPQMYLASQAHRGLFNDHAAAVTFRVAATRP